MITYYSTFITGLQEIVASSLKKNLKDARIDLLLDGLIVYRTSESLKKILSIRFLNNTFVLIDLFRFTGRFSVSNLMRNVLKRQTLVSVPARLVRNQKSFRIIASEENQLVSIEKNLLEKLEQLFGNKLQLKIDRAKPDIEVWFLKRKEGYGFVGLRLTQTPNYEKLLHKGELRPELVNLMCLMAELDPSGVVLDPFAGYGSVPIECVKNFKVKQVMAGEKDKAIFKLLEKKINKLKLKITVGKWDALNLASLTNESVSRIITDPPWGLYKNESIGLEGFYKSMFNEFIRVLKPSGLMVILMGQKELFSKVISGFPELKLLEKYDTLVSGKKATIFKIGLTP